MDVLLYANQEPNDYYMAARAYSSGFRVPFTNSTATARIQYSENYYYTPPSTSSCPPLPYLPNYNDTRAAFNFITSIRGLPHENAHEVPKIITTHIVTTVSVNTFPCPRGKSCMGPNGNIFAASMNNISFKTPSYDILEAYYYHIHGVFRKGFPKFPPFVFNFIADSLPVTLNTPKRGTKVVVVKYGATVEVVFQGTNLLAGLDHPMHLHGFSFHVVGYGFGNFNKRKSPMYYNLIDPPLLNTVIVPKNGWAAIRFVADNPGIMYIWFEFL